MDCILTALAAPFLFSISLLIDKYLIGYRLKGAVGTLILFSCLIGIPTAFFIALFNPAVLNVSLVEAVLLVANGILFISYLFPYLYALNDEDASTVVPLFQTIPVFGVLLSFLVLGETLAFNQIIAVLVVVAGSVGLTAEFKKRRIKARLLALMLSATFIVALSTVFFKFFALQTDFWTTSFWQYIGFGIVGIFILLLSRKTRNHFSKTLKESPFSLMALNLGNELIYLAGLLILDFALLLGPVAIIQLFGALQPFFILFLSTLIAIAFPALKWEKVERKLLLQKAISIIVIFSGIAVLFLG